MGWQGTWNIRRSIKRPLVRHTGGDYEPISFVIVERNVNTADWKGLIRRWFSLFTINTIKLSDVSETAMLNYYVKNATSRLTKSARTRRNQIGTVGDLTRA